MVLMGGGGRRLMIRLLVLVLSAVAIVNPEMSSNKYADVDSADPEADQLDDELGYPYPSLVGRTTGSSSSSSSSSTFSSGGSSSISFGRGVVHGTRPGTRLIEHLATVDAETAEEYGGVGGGNSCYDGFRRPQRCIPEFVNAAFNVRVEASNTCGLPPIEYCMQTGVTGARKLCEMCDSNHASLAHPPHYLTDFNSIDNNLTWWQSETMYQGIQYPEHVTLTLSFRKAFDITYVRLKFHSPRPESFAIYKKTSEDGPWIPYQYYSSTCRDTYSLPDGNYITIANETQPMCSNEFSDISPLTGGNVAFSTLEGRPSAYKYDSSPLLQEFVTATDIRVSLDRLNTFGDEVFGDRKVLQSYYYAISDFSVGGRCKCNGHANRCERPYPPPPPSSAVDYEREGRFECVCEHNTAGPDCNECLPFFNDQPWGRATASDAHECKPCNCNGRSEKCFFDKDLYVRTNHGGHCLDCRDSTDGPNCERCKENYYERSGDGLCVACQCDRTGSRSLQCDRAGRCHCKPGVTGDKCDRCEPNHYDFGTYGCRACGCSAAGSYGNSASCDTNTGVCRCKENVEGQQCDRCKPGYFNLNDEDEFGCTQCFCYGHSSVCRSDPGYRRTSIESTFTRDRERWTAVDQYGQTVPTQYNAINHVIGVSAPSREPVYFSAPDRWLGDQRGSYNQLLSFTLRLNSSESRASSQDVIVEGGRLSISQPIYGQRNPSPSAVDQAYKFRLHEHANYGWTPRLSAHDFASLLSNVTSIRIRATYTPHGIGFLKSARLETASRLGYGRDAGWIEMCTCPEGYVGAYCESCAPGFRHDPPSGGPFARCVPCDCHGHADICDADTGRCICRHDTAGDTCERCARGFYGNALRETANDCRPCPCPDGGGCMELLDGEVVCLQCSAGYAGPRCDMCTDGFFGDPQGRYGTPYSCARCDCNGNIDNNAVGNCNRTTGECLKCVYHTTGTHCERCLSGFFGDALSVVKGDCKPCDCYPPGTVSSGSGRLQSSAACSPVTGQCHCLSNVIGQRCDQCEDGFWDIRSGNGCKGCDCDPLGSDGQSCDINSGQCVCRPGVTGKRCDVCSAHHYGFSPKGCDACDCDVVGARSRQCDVHGQCQCMPNVEGRRCDRCKENKHNKSAGCIDCPPCYNLVQVSAKDLVYKLAKLDELLQSIENSPDFENATDFEHRLFQVQQRVNVLLEDAKNAQGTEGDIAEKLRELRDRITEVKGTASKIHLEIGVAAEDSSEGVRNISLAEEAIRRAREALREAQRYLENEGRDALDQAQNYADRFGQQSQRMTDISRLARQEADRQEVEAVDIERVAETALNTSKEAFHLIREAIGKQRKTSDEIRDLRNDLRNTEKLMEETKKAANETLIRATEAYDKALSIYTNANGLSMPSVDVDRLTKAAEEITSEAQSIQEEVERLNREHEKLLGDLQYKIIEAEDLLRQGMAHQQEADELLSDADAALSVATDAVQMGDKTLEEAMKTLETLKTFDQMVRESKAKADEALKLIPHIEELIHDAEDRTAKVQAALSGAQRDAGEALRIAQEAQRIAEQSSRDADGIRKEADRTKERAGQLKDKADLQEQEVAVAAARLAALEEQADEEKGLANQAQQNANAARENAEAAGKGVTDALDTVNDILDQLGKLKDIDVRQLAELERRLAEAERVMAAAELDRRLAELQQARLLQNQWVRDYEEALRELRKDVNNVKSIKDALPTGCYKRARLEP